MILIVSLDKIHSLYPKFSDTLIGKSDQINCQWYSIIKPQNEKSYNPFLSKIDWLIKLKSSNSQDCFRGIFIQVVGHLIYHVRQCEDLRLPSWCFPGQPRYLSSVHFDCLFISCLIHDNHSLELLLLLP